LSNRLPHKGEFLERFQSENKSRTKPYKYRALSSSMTQQEARRISYIADLNATAGCGLQVRFLPGSPLLLQLL
jgi:hypothetical protein